MIFVRKKRIISSFTIAFYLFSIIAFPANASSESYNGLNEIKINDGEIDYGTVVDKGSVENHYIDSSIISKRELLEELHEYYSALLQGDEKAQYLEIYSGDSCSATACVEVSSDYGSYSLVSRNNYHLSMREGNRGNSSTNSFGTSYSSDPKATASQLSRLSSINRQIESQNYENARLASHIETENGRLSSLNSEHRSAKSQLTSVESRRNEALQTLNASISDRNMALNERTQAKQQASNARMEAERQQSAVNNQKAIREDRTANLESLKEQTETLLNSSDSYVSSFESHGLVLDSRITAAIEETSQAIQNHNELSDAIIQNLGIENAVSDLSIDYEHLISNENDLEIDVLPDGTQLKTPKSHPKYSDLVNALNYHKSLEDYVGNSTSENVKHAYELSEIGIEQADQAYSEDRNVEGDAYLNGALSMLDSTLDFVPGVSFIKDVTSIVTGVNPITGEDVDDTDRAIMLGTLFAPAALSGATKVVTKVAKALTTMSERGVSSADDLIKVIQNSDRSFSKYVQGPCAKNMPLTHPQSIEEWAKYIAYMAVSSSMGTANASIVNPCPTGSVVDKVLKENRIYPGKFEAGKKGAWNKPLNSPKRNSIYKVNNGSFQTDHLGRTKLVEASNLKLKAADRHGGMQKKAGGEYRLKTDVGGHLWGSRFEGAGELINLVPMDKRLNSNAHDGGAFGRLEMKWAEAIKSGSNVSIKVQPHYTGNSLRPDFFDVTDIIDGVEKRKRIYNRPGG
ncbi:DNA/RNA non-specific endonuclease [Bermanella sp. R86510]|uniref:DNA/RNA non-specific endonuclease n=1 Tax=unclassified Bermanella TaxID=2627862 RepID=UPI0037C60E2E